MTLQAQSGRRLELMIRTFATNPAASGVSLAIFAALALLVANSSLNDSYQAMLDVPLSIHLGGFGVDKPLLLWVNDGLMAIFFLLIGLELKRAIIEGELSSIDRAALPVIAALGGMLVPAIIYAGFNWGDTVAMRGWAIPAATDIAFALGVLALLGSRVPVSLKVFLLAVAVTDDLGVIVIIALFYTESLTTPAVLAAIGAMAALATLNKMRIGSLGPYVLVGLVLWVSVLKSGVHATLAGVVVAAFIPLRLSGDRSPLMRLEHVLHPWVALGVVPVFAFFNAGVSFAGLTPAALLQPVPLGIAMGLVVGKLVGVFGFAMAAIKLRIASRIPDIGGLEMLGVTALCGIGFTMSLFIGSLAFEHGGPAYTAHVRLGILSGSLVAAVLGCAALWWASARRDSQSMAKHESGEVYLVNLGESN